MKVKELVEQLSKYNDDSEVVVCGLHEELDENAEGELTYHLVPGEDEPVVCYIEHEDKVAIILA